MLRSGEGPFFMAEQLAFHERLGEGRAVDGEKSLIAAWAGVVDDPSEQFLASAGLALNQDRNLAAGDALSFFNYLEKHVRTGNHLSNVATKAIV